MSLRYNSLPHHHHRRLLIPAQSLPPPRNHRLVAHSPILPRRAQPPFSTTILLPPRALFFFLFLLGVHWIFQFTAGKLTNSTLQRTLKLMAQCLFLPPRAITHSAADASCMFIEMFLGQVKIFWRVNICCYKLFQLLLRISVNRPWEE